MNRLGRHFVAACLALLLSFGLCMERVTADLVGHWPLDDGTGDVADNKVAAGADGMITNAATGGPGDSSVWVSAADFPGGERTVIGFGGQAPGDTAYVRAGNIPQMTLDNDFTWAFYANQDPDIAASPGQFAGMVGNRYDNDSGAPGSPVDFSPRQFIKFTPTAFEWHMNANGNDNMAYNPDADLNDVTPGVWQHHAVVKDGADLTYYRNGVQWNTSQITQALDLPMPLWFGGDDGHDAAEQWEGLLAEVRTYDNALTAAEVQALVIPEPSTLTLVALGLMTFALRRRRG